MSDTRIYSWRHHDAEDNEVTIGLYADVGVGPAVAFDGGGFTDHVALRAFAFDLLMAADEVQRMRARATELRKERDR